METKICTGCHETKPIEDFSRKRGKYNSRCKACHNAYYKEYWKNTEAYEKHKERVNRNRPHKSRKYGLTEKKYKDLLNKYNGLCWCCRKKPALVIDHCHETGIVRGVLCNGCNVGIGNLGDSLEGVQQAIKYLAAVSPHAYNM